MQSYTIIASAKINLYLEIIGDRPDDYHELVMIMQSINLGDQIILRSNGLQEFRVFCSHPQVPNNLTNLAYRAAQLIGTQFPKAFANYGGVDITIEKRIPVAAGLAGGSSNSAAVLVGIDLLWNLGLTQPELQTLAARLGSDVPFCLAGGTVIATGRGEKLDSINFLDNLWVVLAKYKHLEVSTAWAYQTYRQQFGYTYPKDINSQTKHIHSGSLVQAIVHKNGTDIGKLLHNDLEKVVLPEFPLVSQLRKVMQSSGGLGTMMSGSGPTIFTLCESQIQAEEIVQKIRLEIDDPKLEFWIAQLSNTGIQVVR